MTRCATRQAELGGHDRRDRFHVRRIPQEERSGHGASAVSQPAGRRQRSRHRTHPGRRGVARHAAAACCRPARSRCLRRPRARGTRPIPISPRSRKPAIPSLRSTAWSACSACRACRARCASASLRTSGRLPTIPPSRSGSPSPGQTLNVGGPAEFAKAIDEQRATIAAAAKDLGIAPSQ